MAEQTLRRKIRVLFCHFTADVFGGSDKAVFDLATGLPGDRFEVHALLRSGDPKISEYRTAGVPVTEIPFVPPRRALEPVKLARYVAAFWPHVWRAARAIRRFDADVVHVNTLFNLQGAFAAKLAGRPLVWHIREIVPDSRLYDTMLFFARRLSNRCVAISKAVREQVGECGGRCRLVYRGIDLRPFESSPDTKAVRHSLGIEDDDARLVTLVGRMEPWKGQHVLVEAGPLILDAFPEARLVFVGGPAVNKRAYAAALKARCAELGISDHVIFAGIREDVPAVLAASHVAVLATVTPEPFGLTVIEAMAAGCPVVATDAGGPLETVAEGETGFRVPPEDAEALAGAVKRLLADPEQAAAMGAAGRARVQERFNHARVIEEMAALFEEVQQRPGKR